MSCQVELRRTGIPPENITFLIEKPAKLNLRYWGIPIANIETAIKNIEMKDGMRVVYDMNYIRSFQKLLETKLKVRCTYGDIQFLHFRFQTLSTQ